MDPHNWYGRGLNEVVLPTTGKAMKTGAGFMLGWGPTVPTDLAANNFAKGAHFIHTDGGIGTMIYRNEGSQTSNDFNPMVVIGTHETGDLKDSSGATILADAHLSYLDPSGTVYYIPAYDTKV